MTYKSVSRPFFLFLVCLFVFGKTAQGQGWTSGSHWQDGNPVEPYLSDGNYVSGLSAFFGDTVCAVINFPGEEATYRLEGFQLNTGFKYGRGLWLPQDTHRLARAVA